MDRVARELQEQRVAGAQMHAPHLGASGLERIREPGEKPRGRPLQRSPQGDLVIVTLEGDDPERGFAKMMQASDPFTSWFVDQVNEIHGIDLANGEMAVPTLMVDSEAALVAAG